MPISALFQSIKVGDIVLGHRVVGAPLTRCRANKRGVHGDLAVEHYTQRASFPGTLLISEATYVSRFAEGISPHAPGEYTEEQIAGWKRVADAVHTKGSYIFMQLWAVGRAATLEYLRDQDPDFPYVAPSDIPMSDRQERPRALSTSEIDQLVADFAQAAHNAVYCAGFDGVEVHGAYGYLVDQFTQDVSNQRCDDYGGSVENRCRFALEVVDAVSRAVGQSKTAFRISPWSKQQGMRMRDPIPTFAHLVCKLSIEYPHLAYLHIVEPGSKPEESNDFIRKLWLPRPLINAGRYSREKALEVAEETGQLIAFGRAFVSNPDLPKRLLKNIPLADWDPELFDSPEDPHGYIDYPFADDDPEDK